jgi:carboxypeptidase Q
MRRHHWPAVELSQDGTNYFDVHHTVHDTLDRVDLAHCRRTWRAGR